MNLVMMSVGLAEIKIRDVVVEFVAVDMMDGFPTVKASTKNSHHHPFVNSLSGSIDVDGQITPIPYVWTQGKPTFSTFLVSWFERTRSDRFRIPWFESWTRNTPLYEPGRMSRLE